MIGKRRDGGRGEGKKERKRGGGREKDDRFRFDSSVLNEGGKDVENLATVHELCPTFLGQEMPVQGYAIHLRCTFYIGGTLVEFLRRSNDLLPSTVMRLYTCHQPLNTSTISYFPSSTLHMNILCRIVK